MKQALLFNVSKGFLSFLLGFCLVVVSTVEGIAQTRMSPLESRISLLQLEVFRLESKLRTSSSPEAIEAELGHTLEQLSAYNCISMSTRLVGEARNDKDSCTKYLTKLKEVAPHSAFLPCIEYGQDSTDCYDAFTRQQVMPWSEAAKHLKVYPKSGDIPKSFKSGIIGTKRKYELFGFNKELAAYKEKRNAKTHHTLVHAYGREIGKFCKDDALIFYRSSEELGTWAEDFRSSKNPELNNLRGMVERYQKRVERKQNKDDSPFSEGRYTKTYQQRKAKRRETTEFEAFAEPEEEVEKNDEPTEPPVRIRVVPDMCLAAIEATLKTFPLASMAVCARDGRFSPTCRNASTPKLKQDPNDRTVRFGGGTEF